MNRGPRGREVVGAFIPTLLRQTSVVRGWRGGREGVERWAGWVYIELLDHGAELRQLGLLQLDARTLLGSPVLRHPKLRQQGTTSARMHRADNSVRRATACNAHRCSRGRPETSEHYGLQAAGRLCVCHHYTTVHF